MNVAFAQHMRSSENPAASLHGPRLRQLSSSLVCVPEAAHRLTAVFFAPTARSLNAIFYGVRPISLHQYCRRMIPSGGLSLAQWQHCKSWHHLANSVVKIEIQLPCSFT
nr:hypothetical protein [uncultured Tolumonas sp.]